MSKSELVGAVSNASGLGILSSANFFTKETFSQEVRKIKNLTDKRFAVNLVYLPIARYTPSDDLINVILEDGIKMVETVGPIQPPLIEKLHQANITCILKVISTRRALAAERSGVDAVTIEGFECPGHLGMDNVTSLILIQRAVQQDKIPVIAAGGFGDGKGLVAALLGAKGILTGARFFLTKECPAYHNIKEWCLKALETDTTFALTPLRSPVRCARTDLAERMLGMEVRGAGLQQL